MEKIRNFLREEDGNATEYGLIIALVSVAIMVGAQVLGGGLSTLFNDVGTRLSSVSVPGAAGS